MNKQFKYLILSIILFSINSCSDSEVADNTEININQEPDGSEENLTINPDEFAEDEEETDWRMVLSCQIGDYQEQAIMVLTWYPKDENGIYPIDGYYYYVKYQKNLDLEGYSEPSTRKIYLNESYKGKPTGYIVFLQDDTENESYWAPSKESDEQQEFNQEEIASGDIYELDLVINNGTYTLEHEISMYNSELDSFETYPETSELLVSNINDEFLAFDLYVVGNNAHIGQAKGLAIIEGTSAIWEVNDDDLNCKLIFDLSNDKEIRVEESDCEYYHGANAYFDGTFIKKE